MLSIEFLTRLVIFSLDVGIHWLGGLGMHSVDSGLKSIGWIDLELRVDLHLLIAAVCGRHEERKSDRSAAIKGGSLKRRNPFRSVDGKRNTITERPDKERKPWPTIVPKAHLTAAVWQVHVLHYCSVG